MDFKSITLPRAVASCAFLVLATCVVGCASTRSLDDVLGSSSDGPSLESGDAAASPDEIRRITKLADDGPSDAQAQLDAARVLAAAVDELIVVGQVDALPSEGSTALSVQKVVLLDDNLADDLCADILGLASAGMKYAKAAEKQGEGTPELLKEAAYFHGFHLSLVAWGEGSATAALRGRGPALAKLLKRLVESQKLIEDAGPLRLRGRFLDRAPWPYKDRDVAIDLLREAVDASPVAINHQFLGDALWSDGDKDDAIAAWRAGVDAAESDELTAVDKARQELLQARLSAAEGSDSN